MTLFKDEHGINSRNRDNQRYYLGRLADICREAFADASKTSEILRRELGISEAFEKKQEHDPKHNRCEGCGNDRATEKRICRCMFYYNNNYPKKCENVCKLRRKWKNIGKYKIVEYEWPTKYVIKNIGGIDLIIESESEPKEKYGVEVKPESSKETLSRMVAEILTYTTDTYSDFKPAIAVFKDSKQYKDIEYLKKEKNMEWGEIVKHIKVFVIIVAKKDGIHEFEFKEDKWKININDLNFAH